MGSPGQAALPAQGLLAAALRAAPAPVAVSSACNFCSVDTEKELVLLCRAQQCFTAEMAAQPGLL